MPDENVNVEVDAGTESPEPSYSYVLHGANAYCDCGSRVGRLTVSYGHGTDMHASPLLNENDTKEWTPDNKYGNVHPFGFCYSFDNPDRLAECQKVMDAVNESRNLLDTIMDFFPSPQAEVETTFMTEDGKQIDCHGYSAEVFQRVTVCCVPQFARSAKWSGTTPDLQINGINALNSGCTLQCMKGNATVHIADDGQITAADEQHGTVDMSSWKPGDPYPPITQGNLEQVDDRISALDAEIEACTDSARKAELESEKAALTDLKTGMVNTRDMLNEMQNNYNMLRSNGDEQSQKEAQQYLNDMAIVQEAYNNGTPIVPMDPEKVNEDINGAYQLKADGKSSDEVSEFLAGQRTENPYGSFLGSEINEENADYAPMMYCDGHLMNNVEYNEYVNSSADTYLAQTKAAEAQAAAEAKAQHEEDMKHAGELWKEIGKSALESAVQPYGPGTYI